MKEKAKRERSKNLNDDTIEKIVEILDGWSGSLTWNNLITEIELRLKDKYVRQTLAKHTRIKSAYHSTKKRISDEPATKSKDSVEIQVLQQVIAKLDAKNARLNRENQDLLAQFARWQYNSYVKGVTKEELDKPLPKVDRR
jgi:hypothetical protein